MDEVNPTLLLDEADSFLKENEELRGVINSGHTRQSAYVIRTVGDVERLHYAEAGLFGTLASKLARFAEVAGSSIAGARPELREALNDRAQDNWEPLLAIADHAGGEWPQWALSAALHISGTDQGTASLSTELLQDIHDVLGFIGVTRAEPRAGQRFRGAITPRLRPDKPLKVREYEGYPSLPQPMLKAIRGKPRAAPGKGALQMPTFNKLAALPA